MNQHYQNLVQKLEEIAHLNGVMSTLGWDQEVMMPAGAGEARAKQMAALAGVIHERMTDPALGDCLNELKEKNSDHLGEVERCNIREALHSYELETKVPKRLVQELAELSSRGQGIWVMARKENKFSDFAPVLKRFLALKTEWAQRVSPDLNPYDANIDLFERGTTMDMITPIFERLKQELIPLIEAIQNHPQQPDTSFLQGRFALDKQEALARKISQDIGFNIQQGRIDVSVHPFCGGSHPTDVRITTRYKDSDFIESLYSVIHETGHALYEQGRPYELGDVPAAESLTMGIHESQSLFWERMVAQGKPFCSHYFDKIRATFPDNLQSANVDSFYRAINTCKPGFIRVEADEVTYPLHVILRYEIEKGLFDDSMRVDDLPDIWNELMRKYLGITPPTDTLGVLQDSHWSGGAFGYFPSYTLGAIYACQFYTVLLSEQPETEMNIATGNFVPIKRWLNEKIHRQGRLYTPQELVQRVTGEALSPDHFIHYLTTKYSEIYQLG
ncbi:carboxypeptidase M32 [Nitrosomonas ureae]|uniref:Metal-dependent carboxypeptidase n=1 Tax=Nitrosomonas ureae TaxID=44577 RepID=A0A2T5IS56_9PROT|nr:carboxypeptidase M32 [Nitrosomonas ureae]PTQ86647.1 carboxypeptidase Taq [Nitrosomonas ureae]